MKNKLVFASVVAILFIMGVAAGSVAYSAIYLASWVNRMIINEWLPYVLFVIIAAATVITAYFTYRFIQQCRMLELPKLKDDEILPMTVIIPALNEERTIARCVDSLMAADYPRDKLKIIIAHEVPPRCTDSTPQLAARLAQKYASVQVVPNRDGHRGTKAGAINNCLKDVSGEIIGIYDADNVVEPDALLRATARFAAQADLACMGGKVIIRDVNYNMFTTIMGNECAVINNFSRYVSQLFTGRHMVYGSNLFIRKDVLEKMGGFNEATLTEDCDLGMKLIYGNYNMTIDYSVKSYEQPAVTLTDWWRQRVRWTAGSFSVLKDYGRADGHGGIAGNSRGKSIKTFLLYSLGTTGILFSIVLMGFLCFMLYMDVLMPLTLLLFLSPLAVLFAAASIVDFIEGRGSITDTLLSLVLRPFLIFAYSLVGVYALVMDAMDRERVWYPNQRI